MAITRTTSGLLYAAIAGDADHPHDAGDWNTSATLLKTVNGSGELELVNNHAATPVIRVAALTGIAPRSQAFMALRATASRSALYNGLAFHIADTSQGSEDACAIRRSWGLSPDRLAHTNVNAGATSAAATTSDVANVVVGTLARLSADIDGATVYTHDLVGGVDYGPTTFDKSSGQVGVYIHGVDSDVFTVHTLVVGTGKSVTVSNITGGRIAAIRNSAGTILAQATESGGTATIDTSDLAWGDGTDDPYDLAVYESDGTTLIEAFAPSSGAAGEKVWPGDVYDAAMAPAFSAGAIALGTIAPTSVEASETSAPTDAVGTVSRQWQRRETGGSTWADVTGQTTTEMTDSGRTAGERWDYRLRYEDSADPGAYVYSNTVSAVVPTDGGTLAYPSAVLAEDADVNAFAADQLDYHTSVTLPEGRIAVGVMMETAADGSTVTFTVEGMSAQVVTLDRDYLSQPSGAYFEDGAVFDVPSAGTYRVLVESGSANLIRGVVIRAPDPISGCVQDHGGNNGAAPISCVDDGDHVWRQHVEMYTSARFASRDGAPMGMLWNGSQFTRNDRFHNGGNALNSPGRGVVFVAMGHQTPKVYVTTVPNGGDGADWASRTDHGGLGAIGSAYAYPYSTASQRAGVDAIYVACRGDSAGAYEHGNLLTISGAFSGTPTLTEDVLGVGATDQWWYPVHIETQMVGGAERVFTLWQLPDPTPTFTYAYHVAAIFEPETGAAGIWRSGDRAVASGDSARGTAASPRFAAATVIAPIGSGGLSYRSLPGSGDLYVAGPPLVDLSEWATTGAQFGYIERELDASGVVTALRWRICIGAAITNEALPLIVGELTTNPVVWDEGAVGAGVAYALIGEADDRSALTFGPSGESYEADAPYFDRGNSRYHLYEFANPLDPATFAGTDTEQRLEAAADGLIMPLVLREGTWDLFDYQSFDIDQELHPTHRQGGTQTYTLAPAVAAVVAVPFTASAEVTYSPTLTEGTPATGETIHVGFTASAEVAFAPTLSLGAPPEPIGVSVPFTSSGEIAYAPTLAAGVAPGGAPAAVVELLARIDRVHAGAVGVAIRVVLTEDGAADDLAGLTARTMRLVQPDGTALELEEAVVSVSTTEAGQPCLEYVTGAGELAMAGVYTVQGHIERGSRVIPAEPRKFRVYPGV